MQPTCRGKGSHRECSHSIDGVHVDAAHPQQRGHARVALLAQPVEPAIARGELRAVERLEGGDARGWWGSGSGVG